MMHFPPFNFKKEESDFTRLIEEAGVQVVVFGHLHGLKNKQNKFVVGGIDYFLTSCDMLENKLIEIDV